MTLAEPSEGERVWVAAMDRHGREEVRDLIARAGPGEGASVHVGDKVTARDWARGLAIAAMVITIAMPLLTSWLFPGKR